MTFNPKPLFDQLHYWLPFMLLLILSCVGSESIDDPIVDETLSISTTESNLLIGGTTEIEINYTDEFGVAQTVEVEWISTNSTVATAADGVITALAKGQTMIMAQTLDVNGDFLTSNTITITVIENLSDLSVLTIEATNTMLMIGDSVQLTYEALDGNNEPYSADSIKWESSDSAVVSVNQNGLAIAKSDGSANVFLMADGIQSNTLLFAVGKVEEEMSITRSFTDDHYTTEGTVTLSKKENGDIILSTDDGFKVSGVPEPWIYLSNSTNANTVLANGLPVADVTDALSGARSYNLTNISGDITLNKYRYVIILCKPFAITMSYADMF